METVGMEGAHVLAAYARAYGLWQQRQLAEAEAVLSDCWRQCGMQSLRGMLLMAYILRDQKRYVSEMSCLVSLLERFAHSPEASLLAEAWSLLGSVLRMLGESRLSVEAFRKSAAVEPDARQKLVEESNAIFSANAIDPVSADFMQVLYAEYRTYLAALPVTLFPARRYGHARIRVGYLSADLRDHAVGQFVRALLTQFDPEAFSVYVYALSARQDAVTAALRAGGAQWREAAGWSFEEIARAVRRDEIDVLVDLGGHTAGNALPVFAWRPAPVQISGIGYFSSTGIDETTGFLSDVFCAPQPRSPYFTEPLLRLPQSHFCYQPFSQFPGVGEPPCLRKGYVTFGCFNNFSKVSDRVLAVWRDLLRAVPGAHLLLKHQLFDSEEGRRYTQRRLRCLGLPLACVEMRGLSQDYLAQYHDVDIALDTRPYTGGLTTCEALYMGVPVVTWIGGYHGARFGWSFLANLGLEELAAADDAAYLAIAAALAGDWDLLRLLHRTLRERMQRSPLMDARRYVAEMEALYRALVARERHGGGDVGAFLA